MSPCVLIFLPAAGPAAGNSMWMAVDRVMLKESSKGWCQLGFLFIFFSSFAFLFFLSLSYAEA